MSGWKWGVLVVLPLAGASGIYGYDRYSHTHPSTENAYLDANVVRVAAQVSGPVVSVDVSSQQAVKKGDRLLSIDDTLYRANLQEARARLALAQREVAENRAEVAAAEASVNEARVTLENAVRHRKRVKELEKSSYLSIENADDAEATFRRAEAALKVAEARLRQAEARLSELDGRDGLVVQAEASLERARWELQHTVVSASCDGVVEDVGLQPGTAVQAQNPLFVVVCSKQWWVRANFKETQLERVRPGQAVDVTVDMYPGQNLRGVVESISPASGTAFSMLPPENATGNWVKVTQRVPVRIRLQDLPSQYPLRAGTSAVVTIDTTSEQTGA